MNNRTVLPMPEIDPSDQPSPDGTSVPSSPADGTAAAPSPNAGTDDLSGRELTMQTPAAGLSGRELTMTPSPGLSGRELTMTPSPGLSGRELTMTPSPGLSGRELTMQTPATGISGRELTMQTPATGISGREMTLETAGIGVSGREMTLETPATGISGREMTMQGATPTPATVGGKPRTDQTMAGFKPRTGVGTSIAFDDAWHLQGRKGPHTGQAWGDFDLGGILGEGGMGAVYRAKQRSLRRRVAIKVLPPNLSADVRLLQRFQLEATTTSKLQTPHVVQVYAIGEHEGNHYYAMEYVEGKDLYDIIKDRREEKKPLTPDEACGYIVQAAKGLAEAGRHQIVHRDIKPPNMMVTKDGLLKIADFGIVKVLGEHQLTMTGQAVGTPAYVSPEQGRGDKEVDCRSDLYSLGVVFYELVCDKKPFDGSTPNALIYQHCYEEPKLPKELNAAVSDEIQAVIMRCLQKNPENRYQSADDLVRDLEAIRTGSMLKSAIANYKLGTGADEAKREQMNWVQRNLLKLTIAAGLVVAAGAVGGWFWVEKRSAQDLVKKQAIEATERLKQTLGDYRAAAPVPNEAESMLVELVKASPAGEKDDFIVGWRAKLGKVRPLQQQLAQLDQELTREQRTAGPGRLNTYEGLVGTADSAAQRWRGRLAEAKKREDDLRGKLGVLDQVDLTLPVREQLAPLLDQLSAMVAEDDKQAVAWRKLVADFDAQISGLSTSLAVLDDGKTRITESLRLPLTGKLAQFKVKAGETDERYQRWNRRLAEAGTLVERLRKGIGAKLDPIDRPSLPLQDAVELDLAQVSALTGEDDPDLKRWRLQIKSANDAIAKLRERLAPLDQVAKDDLLEVALVKPMRDGVEELRQLARPGDAELQRWERTVVRSEEMVRDFATQLRRLDPAQAEPITVAEQAVLAAILQRFDAKGGITGEQRTTWLKRLDDEKHRVAASRERLKAFDQPVSIEENRVVLARFAIDVGEVDADVRRWRSKESRVDDLLKKLAVLDTQAPIPPEVGDLFKKLRSEVGDDDASVVRWKEKVRQVEEVTAALAPLDRAGPIPASAVADLARLRSLVGSNERGYLRRQAKLDRVGELKAELGRLAATYGQSPAANAQSHKQLEELLALVGAEDGDVPAYARRLALLDGPGKPTWAGEAGRDEYGTWARVAVGEASIRFRYVPPGSFVIGSALSEIGREADEDQVEMEQSKAFWLAEQECTQEQWSALQPANPSFVRGAGRPVERVSWGEVSAWLEALRKAVPGLEARLPSEAEWEYAARAGSASPWAMQDASATVDVDAVAWHAGNSNGQSHEARQRFPNPLGFYDLAGNVWEWCADRYGPYPTTASTDRIGRDGELRVVRGGSWGDPASSTRAANRQGVREELRSAYIGFRIAAEVQWSASPDGKALLASSVTQRRRVVLNLGGSRVAIEMLGADAPVDAKP
jgi:tRNA A-37 threonylcarbamoyl transferase component Bud32